MKKTIPFLVLGMLPLLTLAAGFQINEDSPRLQGQAMAGSGSDMNDITAIFNNPALLASIQQNQAYLGGSYIIPNITMNNAQSSNDTYISSRIPYISSTVSGSSSQDNVASSAFVPNLFAAYKINSQFTAGLAITAPWGLTTDYNSDSVARYLAQKTSLETINVSPELAYKLNAQWQFGIGLQAQYAKADFSEFDGSAALLPATSPTTLSGNGWSYGYNLGVTYMPLQTTTIGLSYRSEIDYDLHGTGQQYVQQGPIQPTPYGPGSDAPYNSDTSVTAQMNTPAVLNLSATQQLSPKWSVSTSGQLTFWHSMKNIVIKMPDAYSKSQTITLNWKDSWLFTLGTQYKVNQHWTLRTGVAYDQTPTIAEYRDARIPDANRYWGTLGASYTINSRFIIDAAYEHIFMQNQHIDANKQAGVIDNVPHEKDTLSADYSGNANIFALGVNWKF